MTMAGLAQARKRVEVTLRFYKSGDQAADERHPLVHQGRVFPDSKLALGSLHDH